MEQHRPSLSVPRRGPLSKLWHGAKTWIPLIWDSIVALSIIVSTFLVIFQLAFDASLLWQWGIVYLMDVLYCVHIALRFLRGYQKKGELITNKKKIALNYIRTSFFPDLISVLPLEIFCIPSSNYIYVAAFLRLNRCIRCYRVWTFLSAKEKELGTNTMLLMSLRFVFLAGFSVHVIAGVWYSLSCYNEEDDRTLGMVGVCKTNAWIQFTDIDMNRASLFQRYTVALYWAATTVTSVGYGDILPSSSVEKWLSTLFMLWGVILFGYILGELASMLTNADAQRARYIHRLNTIRDHLNEAGISGSLKKKVVGYYEYLWKRNKGKGATELMDELPLAFQAELSLETYQSMIARSSLFDQAPEEFMRMLSLVVKHMLYLPQQVILKKGDIGHHMYCIGKGEVEVIHDEDSPPIAVLKEGDLFGEINLVYGVPSGGLVRAKTHCDILLLSKTDVQHILQHFPEVGEHMKEDIKNRCDAAFQVPDNLGTSVSTLVADGSVRTDRDVRKRSRALSQQQNKHREGNQLSDVSQCCKSLTKRAVIPGSKFSVFWDIFIVLITLFITCVYSYQAGFSRFKPDISYGASIAGKVLFSCTYFLDLILLADIFVSMKRAIVTPTEVITNPRAVCFNYMKSLGFVLDVLAVLPLEIFALAWSPSGDQWSYVALFRINRLLKLWKVVSFFAEMQSSLYISIAHVTLLKFSVYILIVTHLSACLWFPIACFYEGSCLSSSWAASHNISPVTSAFHDYLISIYWASATMTTVGYGDVRAHNAQEMILALTIQLIGVMLYGYCLGAIAATLTNVASPRVSFQEKMQVVHQFMFDHKLGKGLLERVDHYFTLLWDQYRGEAVPGGESLMCDMPQSVREDVSMEECSDLLNNVPVFLHADNSFLRQVSLTTSTYLFAPGDIVLYSGDMGREMYCIRKGYVEILSEDLSQVVSVLGPGRYFGELGFLFGAPRTSAVRAATHCQLVMLKRSHVDKILEHFPLVAKEFETLSSDKDHLKLAQQAVVEASAKAMRNPRKFAKPCTMTALAVAMATPLSVVVRASISNTIAACVGAKDTQSKLSGPISMGETYASSVVKFKRKEFTELLKEEREQESRGGRASSTNVRQRRPLSRLLSGVRHSSGRSVAPAVSRVTSVRSAWVDVDFEEEGNEPRPQSMCQRVTNYIEKVLSYCLIPYTFIPSAMAGRVWETIIFVQALLTVVTISLQAAFLHNNPTLWTINYILDVLAFTDMVLKLHTSYYNSDGVLITQPIQCAKHYFKTNFLMDLLSSFPTDIVVLIAWTGDISDVLRILSIARLNRLLRIHKMPLAFEYLEGQIARSTGLIMEIKFALYMSLGTHLTACGWFLLACASLSAGADDSHVCGRGSWALRYSETPLSNFSIPYQYIVSLYWATATTTTVGYGDIRAYTDLERSYATVVMVIGVVAYGYIIASVAASLANADSGRAQYQEKLKAVKSYLKDQSMDTAITQRVINYYEYIWQRNKGVSFVSLFQGMPISLQADISLSLYKKIIDQVPLFQNTEIGFTKLLALSIKPVLFLSKEYVVRKGDIGSEMFFINRGSVEVVSEDGSVVFATMNEGKFFGEISLVFSCPRTASIRAATNCDLFVLMKTDLDRALTYYPHIEEQIRKVAGNRANLVKKRSQIAAKAAAEGKSASDAAKEAAQGTKGEDDEDGGDKPSQPQPQQQQPATSTATTATASSSEPTKTGAGTSGAADSGGAAAVEKKEVESKPKEEEVSAVEVEPPVEPTPSCLTRCGLSCKTKVWPLCKKALTFTIPKVGVIGTTLHLLGCLLAYFSAFTISYQASFQNNSPILWGINYIFEAYFLFEIFIKFHLAYEDAQGRVVTEFKAIALHYLKDPTGFALDLAAVFPYELIGACVPQKEARTAVLLYLRLPHVIRVIRIQWFFSVEEKRLNQKTLLIRILKFIVMISLCTHFVACLWYILGCQVGDCRPWSWAGPLFDSTSSDADHYCNSLYWAVATMTTTGYGDLSATNVQEMIYAIAVMVVGKLLFGFILGSIASTLANLDTQRVLYEEKLVAFKDYMREQHLSGVMQQRVLKFFDYLWVRNKGIDRKSLFADMPYCMQAEVSLATTEPLLRNVSIFAPTDDAFLRHLTLVIKPCIFLPGEYIVHKGDVGLGMFFLYHGTVEVVDGDSETTSEAKEILKEGSCFGQKSLLYNTPMESSARAITHIDMFTFSQADFEHVLKDHPTMGALISEVAEREYGVPAYFAN